MNDSPALILFNTDGYELSVKEGPVSSQQPGIAVGGISNDEFVLLKLFNNALAVTQKPSKNILGRYFSSSELINGSNLSQTLITIENPEDSNVDVCINKIDVNGVVTGTFSTPFLYAVSRTSSLPADGTVLSFQKRISSDGYSESIVRQLSTASFDAGFICVCSAGIQDGGSGSVNRPKSDVLFFTDNENLEIILKPGEALGVVAGENSNNWRHYVNISWSESEL